MNPKLASIGHLERNATAHDRVAHSYNDAHPEIYNPVEQSRLKATIDKLLQHASDPQPRVLDFGAGTGNLTLKFAERGCRVVAADVSDRSLKTLLSYGLPHHQIAVTILTNASLPFPDASFDIAATYSVLHHVPNYLYAVQEMARVVRPGGLLYIDHEFSDSAWSPSEALVAYRRLTKLRIWEHVWQLARTGDLFTAEFAKTAFMKMFLNRRYEREGDLHVWPDDHIEWSSIVDTLNIAGLRVIESADYLLFQPRGGLALHRSFANTCADTHYVIARKGVS